MNLKRNKLRDAIAFSLAVGAVSLGAAGAASAQDQSAAPQSQSPTSLDAVTVTGTRLRSQTMTGSSPIAEIQGEEFRITGATTVEDLVNQYPQLNLTFDNFQNNGSTGYATVDLRSLGPQRTLTLVNGRRIPKGLGETPDISIIPSALVRRVDILTGGASAVYGSDAIAGVVNFLLDDEFEGVSVNLGYSAYQHDNDNGYLPPLMDARGFDYPTGNSGFDGIARNIDVAVGGSFGDGGHAMAWATWRKNEPLLQGQRDYSSCALNNAGTACGGSATADPGNFYIFAPSVGGFYALPSASGTWAEAAPYLYNYAPVNYFQRPDDRYTAGAVLSYEINEHFEPYIETMFVNRKSSTQIAASGAFFTDVAVTCDTPVIGTMCADLGITDDEFTVYVAKRNVEGGPRVTVNESTNYQITTGLRGAINDNWSYDASFSYGRTSTPTESINDFITTRVRDGILGCPAGSFDGCIPYEVWTDSITREQAEALQGVGIVNYRTDMTVFNAYATGDLGFAMPWANEDRVSLVVGAEYRNESYERVADTNMATGNFTGLGGPITTLIAPNLRVEEIFLESNIPLVVGSGALNRLDMELGYRYSDYNTSGGVDTYKVGFGANFLDSRYRLRAGFNRAIRAPNINELYSQQQIALWAGDDPCAGPTPEFTAAQCALTGVTAAQYGNIAANPAGQYNQFVGGVTTLTPETANTWTAGFAANPIDNLDLSIDYYDIEIEEAIGPIGARNIIDICALSGNEAMCGLIRRNATSGDLFRGSDPAVSGLVNNLNVNLGGVHVRGLDFIGSYGFDLGAGRLTAYFNGNYLLEREISPLQGDQTAAFDCAGRINPQCQGTAPFVPTPEWRHIASARYAFDRYALNLRWRHIGEADYEDRYGNRLDTDVFLRGSGKLDAYNYIDLSGSVQLGDYALWTLGVNNIADKEPPMVGGSLSPTNANAIGGYDQAGRYIFTSVSFKF